MSIEIKKKVLEEVAQGRQIICVGKAKFQIKQKLIHIRFCRRNIQYPYRYKFNINPNTLSSDFEVWICSNDIYYLIPVSLIKNIYENPSTYRDSYHRNIKVVSVDTRTHEVIYATGGQRKKLKPYLKRVLE